MKYHHQKWRSRWTRHFCCERQHRWRPFLEFHICCPDHHKCGPAHKSQRRRYNPIVRICILRWLSPQSQQRQDTLWYFVWPSFSVSSWNGALVAIFHELFTRHFRFFERNRRSENQVRAGLVWCSCWSEAHGVGWIFPLNTRQDAHVWLPGPPMCLHDLHRGWPERPEPVGWCR